jgi:hypothetical protein
LRVARGELETDAAPEFALEEAAMNGGVVNGLSEMSRQRNKGRPRGRYRD